jgi:hypothetical protein
MPALLPSYRPDKPYIRLLDYWQITCYGAKPDMFTLLVNGIPAIKLGKKSEFPPRRGKESWLIIDVYGNTVASYSPA